MWGVITSWTTRTFVDVFFLSSHIIYILYCILLLFILIKRLACSANDYSHILQSCACCDWLHSLGDNANDYSSAVESCVEFSYSWVLTFQGNIVHEYSRLLRCVAINTHDYLYLLCMCIYKRHITYTTACCYDLGWLRMAIMHVSKYMRLLEPTTKILMKIDQHYRWRRCSAVSLVSGNIKFMGLFAGIPWRTASNDRGGIDI